MRLLLQLTIVSLAMAIALGAAYGVMALGEAAGINETVVGIIATIAFAVPVIGLGIYFTIQRSN